MFLYKLEYLTDKMLNYVSDIMKKIGEANYFESLNRYPELRRKSRLRKFLQDKKIETTDNNKKSPNKKYKLTE